MAYSFKITELYCALAIELEQAGYVWQPRAGDWVLDRDDASVGMLTLPITDGASMRRLNYHLPTYVQVNEMLEQLKVNAEANSAEVEFTREGVVLARFARAEFEADEATCRLRALVAAYRARKQ